MLDHKKEAITEHWQFCPKCNIKLYRMTADCTGFIHIKCCVAGKCYGSTFPFEPSKHWFHKNRVQRTLNMDC